MASPEITEETAKDSAQMDESEDPQKVEFYFLWAL